MMKYSTTSKIYREESRHFKQRYISTGTKLNTYANTYLVSSIQTAKFHWLFVGRKKKMVWNRYP